MNHSTVATADILILLPASRIPPHHTTIGTTQPPDAAWHPLRPPPWQIPNTQYPNAGPVSLLWCMGRRFEEAGEVGACCLFSLVRQRAGAPSCPCLRGHGSGRICAPSLMTDECGHSIFTSSAHIHHPTER